MPILFQMIPTNLMSEIKIKHKYTSGPDKSYEGFSRLLIEMERTYDRRAAKGRGENDMDLDTLASERAEQQSAPQAEEEDEYGEDRDYSAAKLICKMS